MSVCCKCQLPTAEAELIRFEEGPPVCRVCMNESLEGSPLKDAIMDSWQPCTPPGFEADVNIHLLRKELGYPEPTPDGPVVSTTRNYRPGRYLYGLEYGNTNCDGVMNLNSLSEAEEAIRTVTSQGGTVKRVYEVQEMLGEEPGTPLECVFMGEWTRERIDDIATGRYALPGRLYEMKLGVSDTPKLTSTDSVAQQLNRRCEQLSRVKLFGVDRDKVLQFVTRGCRYVTDESPEDAEILEVHEDYMRRQFVFTLRHDSFPPVALSDIPPMINADSPPLRAPTNDGRCCLITGRGQCTNDAGFWVGRNHLDDYTHVCAAHVPEVLREGDRVYNLNADGSVGEAADVLKETN